MKWQWEDAEQQAFEALSHAIAETAALRIPDLKKRFVIQTDAGDYGLSAVLMQQFDGVLHPVAFLSHTLTPTERNYTVSERECHAIVFALKEFDMYPDGASFTIQTDHMTLTWLQRLQNPAGRLARWVLARQLNAFTIQHMKGSQNQVTDTLSRAPLPSSLDVEVPAPVAAVDTDARWDTLISRTKLIAVQHADALCRKVIDQLETQITAHTGNSGEFDLYVLSEDGLLLRYISQADDEVDSTFRAPPYHGSLGRLSSVTSTTTHLQATALAVKLRISYVGLSLGQE